VQVMDGQVLVIRSGRAGGPERAFTLSAAA